MCNILYTLRLKDKGELKNQSKILFLRSFFFKYCSVKFFTDSKNFAKHKFYYHFTILNFVFYFKFCLKNKSVRLINTS